MAVNQFSILGAKHTRRPDIILFVNGLPLVMLELKNPADVNADVWKAFDQIQTYEEQIGDAFPFTEVLVISDGTHALLGSLSADRERFMAWRTIDGVTLDPLGAFNELQTLVRGVLAPGYLLEYLRYFVLFEDAGTLIKKIAGYHQFHAVRAAIAQVVAASRPDSVASARGKGGVVWHTQGSGKSITMTCFAARVMQEPMMENPTIVVITDRNDLDGQLFGVFSLSQGLLREQPVQATTRQELRALLTNRPSGGIVFATIQKFMPGEDEDAYPALSDRRNIVVIADEAHRTQYGFEAKLKTLKQRPAVTALSTGVGELPVTRAEFAPSVDRYQVSYIGIANELKQALKEYTASRGRGRPTVDAHEDYSVLAEKLDELRGMLHGHDYSGFLIGGHKALAGAANHVLGLKDRKRRYADTALAMSHAFTLCCTLDEAKAVREEVAFMQGVKIILTKRDIAAQKKTNEARELAIRQIINSAVVSESVVDIFDAVGLDKPNIGILDEAFFGRSTQPARTQLGGGPAGTPAGRRDQVPLCQQCCAAQEVLGLLTDVVARYQNRSIEAAQVMEEPVQMARKFREAAARGEQLGLSEDEVRFYDALAHNESAVRRLGDETMKKIAHELAENLRQNLTVDWSQRESVQAKLRLMVKRILRKYKYPPDQQDAAVELVLQQAKALGEAWA